MKKTIFLNITRAPAEVMRALDCIISDLEHYGRTTSFNGHASRYLGRKLNEHKKKGYIYISYLKEYNPPRHLIALEKNYKVKKISNCKIKFEYESDTI